MVVNIFHISMSWKYLTLLSPGSFVKHVWKQTKLVTLDSDNNSDTIMIKKFREKHCLLLFMNHKKNSSRKLLHFWKFRGSNSLAS